MPLSDYEKHQLDAIEDALAADSPELASRLGTGQRRLHRVAWSGRSAWSGRAALLSRGSWLAPLALLLLGGLASLLFGLRRGDSIGTLMGVLGYLLVMTAVHAGWHRLRNRRRGRARG